MSPPVPFPDATQLEAVRRALWTDRDTGRASVMVGAGMSRNAKPVRPGRATMPTWGDLILGLIDRLYPPGVGDGRRREELRKQAWATSTALRVADEFTAAFGRSALDDAIAFHTPDAEFEPGSLHTQLLSLPWADVLTTNYDTLLERAADRVTGRRYGVVRTAAEIPATARPRIVKLHGSLPSNRPFILTEEDFRTYPRRFAPFVNLAQQAVLETVCCLIGFSGDDPNFNYWTGWDRDHLGEYAPPVYLIGLLDLTAPQRMVLQTRNVVPIDLSPEFPAHKYAGAGDRHAAALGWLLRSLAAGRPPDPLDWPDPPAADPVPGDGSPAILQTAHPIPRRERHRPDEPIP